MIELPRISIVASDKKGNGIQGEFTTLAFGQGLHRAWTYLMLFSSTTIFKSPILVASHNYHVEINYFYLICVLISIATLFLIGLFNKQSVRWLLNEKMILFATILCAAGTVVALFGQFEGGLAIAASLFSGLTCGLSNALLIMFWGMTFARHEVMTIVLNTAISIIVGVVIFAVVLVLGATVWGIVTAAAIPLLELPFIRRWLHGSSTAFANQPKPNYLPTNKKLLGIRLVIPMLLFGFALGIVRYFTVSSVFENHNMILYLLAVFAGSIIMVVLLVIVCFYAESLVGESLIRYMVPILIAGVAFLTLPMLSDSHLISPLLLVCFLYFMALIWIFLCCTCSRFRLSPFFVIGIGYGSLNLGLFFANISLVAHDSIAFDIPLGESTLLALAIIAMVVAYALLPRMADISRMSECAIVTPESRIRKSVSETHREHSQPEARSEESALQQQSTPESPAMPAQSVSQQPQRIPTQLEKQQAPQPAQASAKNTAEQSGNQSSEFRTKCSEISNKYLLSRRENEVLYLLARGHSVSYIQEKLCIAQSTTKTHIYHIYQKLGIHTQQELISMVMDEIED